MAIEHGYTGVISDEIDDADSNASFTDEKYPFKGSYG
jgi:hypothetical protein